MSAKYYREKYYYPAIEAIEIQRLTPHACRHTFASLMSAANVDPLHTQRIIGHSDYAFTANEYTHPEIRELRKAINKI
jgi:integrase